MEDAVTFSFVNAFILPLIDAGILVLSALFYLTVFILPLVDVNINKYNKYKDK